MTLDLDHYRQLFGVYSDGPIGHAAFKLIAEIERLRGAQTAAITTGKPDPHPTAIRPEPTS